MAFDIPLRQPQNIFETYTDNRNKLNSLSKQELENQYYGPNIQSQIDNRNSLTRGYDIANQYAPDRLRLANEHQAQVNQYYAPNIQSEINQRNSLTRGYDIANKYSPDRLRLANQQAQMEYNREKQFEDRFNAAINQNRQGNQNMPVNTNMPVNQNPMNQYTPINQNPMNQNIPVNATPMNPMNQYTPINQNSMNPMNQNIPGNINSQNNISQPPSYNGSQQANPNEQIISQGSPQLSPIDDMYENSPMDRPLLEKKGFKKVQQIKTDKSGKATLITKYPSGKVTMSSFSPNDKDENGIPLTNKMISQHQNVVSSVDVAVPVLDKIIAMQNSEYSRMGGYSNKGAKYAGVVSQALDSLLGAFGLPQTNEGIKTIKNQLEIGHFESPKAYRSRIKELKEDILKRQKYSSGLVKKASKINEDDNKNENDPYNLDSYDLSGE